MKHRRPPLTSREIAMLSGAALLGAAIIAVLLWASIRWTSLAPGGDSFFSSWAGARAYIFLDQDPYGAATAADAQVLAYGRTVPGSADPYRLGLPFYVLPLFFPFAVISDPTLARGVWVMVSQAALVGIIFLSLRAVDWRPSPPVLAVFSLSTFFAYSSIAALVEGTPVVLLLLGYLGVLLAMRSEKDELAGALMAIGLCFWEVGLPFLILVTWRVIHEKRWRILAGLGMTLAILLPSSFLLFPGWLLPFLTATVVILRSDHGLSTSAALLRLSPEYGQQISTALTVIIIGTLLLEWAAGSGSDYRRLVWMACLALAVAPLLGWRTQLHHLIALIPSYALISAAAVRRKPLGAGLAILFLGFAFAIPWILFWRSFALDDRRAADLLFLVPPILSVIGMYWTRWWFLRPQRTWLDEVRSTGG